MSLAVKGASPLQAMTTYKGGLMSIDWGSLAQMGVSLAGQAMANRGAPMSAMPRPPAMGFTGGMGMPQMFGAVAGGMARTKRGRLSGNPIPRGTKEKISRSGQIILTEARRGRGLTSRDLRSFRRVVRLVRSVGMVPKGLHGRGGRSGGFRRKRAA